MKFLVAELGTGRFLRPDNLHSVDRSEAKVFDTEEEALKFCKRFALLSSHAVVPVPKSLVGKNVK